jgi:translation initiation factor 1A
MPETILKPWRAPPPEPLPRSALALLVSIPPTFFNISNSYEASTSRRFRLSPYQEKKEFNPEEEILRTPYPNKKAGEMFGIADQLLGASRIKVMCADGKSRMGRIPGKIRKRMWIREGDLVIIKPWEFQDDKADIKYRYTKTQASYLSRKKILPKNLDVF